MSQPKIQAKQLVTTNDSSSEPRILIDDFRNFTVGVPSPGPQEFRSDSLVGYDAYDSTDFPGDYFCGIVSSGVGQRSMQIAFSWNAEEQRPTSMYIRTNDDTSSQSSWSAWNQVRVGNITFTSSTAIPTGPGLAGDIIYDTTTPRTWVYDTYGTWGNPSVIYQQDNTGTWRNIKQKWVNNAGTWVKVFDVNRSTLVLPYSRTPEYTAAMGETWYSSTIGAQPIGNYSYFNTYYNETGADITAHLYGCTDNNLTSLVVNGVAVTAGTTMGYTTTYQTNNFTLRQGFNRIDIIVQNDGTLGEQGFAIQLRQTTTNVILRDISSWRFPS